MVNLHDLPGIAHVESLARLPALMKDEQADFEASINATSVALFGITRAETFYDRDPDYAAEPSEEAWERHFEFLDWEYEEEATLWEAIGLDIIGRDGEELACFPEFSRQIVCAAKGIHPRARLKFLGGEKSDEELRAEAEAWAAKLTAR